MPVDPSNPWAWNAFQTGTPVGEPAFKPQHHTPRHRKAVPAAGELFQAQRNALKTVNELDAIARSNPKLASELRVAMTHAENTYRVIRRYLKEHVEQQQGGMG